MLLIFGAHNLFSLDNKTIETQLAHVIVHPDWNPESARFDADIAVLITKVEIEFSKYIQPVCIHQFMNLTGLKGFTAGWGLNENKTYNIEPTEIEMPIVEKDKCFDENLDLELISSNKTLCAGSKDGSGPCSGDSGGGLYVYSKIQKGFILQGIVSAGLIDHSVQSCDLTNYVLYTNMNELYDWLTNLC